MGTAKEPRPAKLFMSLIVGAEEALRQGLVELRAAFGETDFMSERFSFHFTDYYAEEMGQALFRHFVAFKDLIPMRALPDIKRTTNRIEKELSSPDGKRRINIDPGYLCMEHILLATTKSYTHRPYLGHGMFAELTLVYRNKSFRPLEWTYPDYRQDEVVLLFNGLRARYVEDLRGRVPHPC